MFEKEAKEYADKVYGNRTEMDHYGIADAFEDGAEFGYYKAKAEIEESYRESLCNSELNLASVTEQLEELEKANEWHYVNWKYFADKDCPKSELSSYLIQLKNKDLLICDWETEEGFGCFWDSNLNPIDNDDVSAWKEIELPKEID